MEEHEKGQKHIQLAFLVQIFRNNLKGLLVTAKRFAELFWEKKADYEKEHHENNLPKGYGLLEPQRCQVRLNQEDSIF